MKIFRTESISKICEETQPSYQAASRADANLGFGFMFYAMGRILRPKNTVVVGSKAGFSPICFGLAVRDNSGCKIDKVSCWETTTQLKDKGKIYFVDPSYSIEREDENHWYGVGFWDDKDQTEQHFKGFGINQIVSHFKMTSAEFRFSNECPKDIDLLYIDGDHSYQGILDDFVEFYDFMAHDGVIMAHDVDPRLKEEFPETGGFKALNELDRDKFEVFRLPVYPGLALVRVKK